MLERLSIRPCSSPTVVPVIPIFEQFIPAIGYKEHGIEERLGRICEACLGILAEYKPNIIHLVCSILDTLPRGQGER